MILSSATSNDPSPPQGMFLIDGTTSADDSMPRSFNLRKVDSCASARGWMRAAHPRVHQVFIPKGACWLNLQEPWWRLFRREALAGQTFVDGNEIERAAEIATQQLNHRAKPWVWGRPPRTPALPTSDFCVLP